ncbi:MAG: carbon-nitrogen hydrolase family protein [Oceanospirillaceae bacterium]|nr:carbon-nitrogen hydrolase family protein [Oceanospirillaceae bacterium]
MKITIAQIDINDNQIDTNTNKIIQLIEKHKNSDIVLFPELALTGFPTDKNIRDKYLASKKAFQAICQITKNKTVNVLIGHIEQSGEVFYNSAFLINNGQARPVHRKVHLWIDDRGVFKAGKGTNLFSIKQHQIGTQICFDLEFPEGARALTKAGADIILMPNGNMHPYENTHLILSQARAIENQVFVATCNRVGSGHGGLFPGESLVVSPIGEILLKMGSEECTHTLELDLDDVMRSRADFQYINDL